MYGFDTASWICDDIEQAATHASREWIAGSRDILTTPPLHLSVVAAGGTAP